MNNIFLILLIISSLLNALPEIDWFDSYNGSGEESHGHYILKCNDGGFLQVGETNFLPNSKILVIKTNSFGQLMWSKEINTGGHNLGNSAIEVDDGYLICGAQNRNSSLIKLNKESGNTLWTKTFNNGGTDAFEHAALTPNGIVVVGLSLIHI